MSREKVFVGQAVQQLNSSPDWGSYSKVILKTGDGEGYVAGNDSGLTLEADCPYATQAIANAVLASLQGGSYKPYEGSRAYITPAAEIGDGMTSDGFYSGIYSLSRQFSKTAAADIGAPSDTEVQHEVQYVSQSERRFTRKMKEVNAELTIKMDKIFTQVTSGTSSFGWELSDTGMVWNSNGSPVMELKDSGLKIWGTLESGSVITGNLYIGGTSVSDMISAATLRSGANSGYNWASGYYGSSGLTNWGYSLTYANNYDNATTSATTSYYPSYFTANSIYAKSSLSAPAIYYSGKLVMQTPIVINGTSYTVLTVRSG